MQYVDCFVVGSGVAGLSAGIYLGRYGLKATVMGKELGGAAVSSWIIENYPGFPSIEGAEFVQKLHEHCTVAGTPCTTGEVESIKKNGDCFVIETSTGRYTSASILFANGAARRKLNLAKESELTGKGIHHCVTCDGPFFKGKVTGVVGGGDASLKSALLLAKFAQHVDVFIREEAASGDAHNLSALEKVDNVLIHYNIEVTQLHGNDFLESVSLSRPINGKNNLKLDGLFVEIGSVPDTHLAQSLGCKLDKHGYLQVDTAFATSARGVFAAGDACNIFGPFKQNVTAAAGGAVAAHGIFNFLISTHPSCHYHHKPLMHHHGH